MTTNTAKKKLMHWEWIGQNVSEPHLGNTFRMRVPSGWIVKEVYDSMVDRAELIPSVAMIFVPDMEGKWRFD